jgi:hypothetical protein
MSDRITFNEKNPDIAWQKQLRDHYAQEPLPNTPLVLKKSVVKRVTRKIAESIILKYEWLGTLPMCSAYYGLFFGNYCAGVTCWSIGGGGANINAAGEWGLAQPELAYLCRGANVHWAPPGSNSRLVSISCRLLAQDFPSAKLAIAYSDTDAGEIGTIYQACNWHCAGRGGATNQWVSPKGRVLDQKMASNVGKKASTTRKDAVQFLKKNGWVEQKSNPKWRYVFPLKNATDSLLSLVKLKSVPYPKRTLRPKQATGGTPDERQCSADPDASKQPEGIA